MAEETQCVVIRFQHIKGLAVFGIAVLFQQGIKVIYYILQRRTGI